MNNRQLRPACAVADVDMYPDANDAVGIARATAVCAGCDLRRECADGALARREQWGVWGGLTEADRRALFRHDRVPDHVVRLPSRAQQRREEVAYLAGQGLSASAIAAQLGERRDKINRDLQHLRGDDQPDQLAQRAATREAKAATINSQIDAMLAAGESINRICAALHVGRPAVYRRRDAQRTAVAA